MALISSFSNQKDSKQKSPMNIGDGITKRLLEKYKPEAMRFKEIMMNKNDHKREF